MVKSSLTPSAVLVIASVEFTASMSIPPADALRRIAAVATSVALRTIDAPVLGTLKSWPPVPVMSNPTPPARVKVSPSAISNAIDLTDAQITNAVNVGDHIRTGGDWTITNTTDIAEGLTFTLAGGVGFDITGTGGQDFRVTNTGGSIVLNATEVATDAIRLNASAGGIDIDAVNSTLAITNTADGVSDDFTIAQAGAFDASLLLTSAGTGADALTISTTQGGIDITAAGNLAGEDLDITATGTTT